MRLSDGGARGTHSNGHGDGGLRAELIEASVDSFRTPLVLGAGCWCWVQVLVLRWAGELELLRPLTCTLPEPLSTTSVRRVHHFALGDSLPHLRSDCEATVKRLRSDCAAIA